MQKNSSIFDYIKNNLFTLPRLMAFIHTVMHSCFALCSLLIYFLLCYGLKIMTVNTAIYSSPVIALGVYGKYIFFLILSGSLIFTVFSNAFYDYRTRKAFEQIGFHNHAGECPVYLWRSANRKIIKMHFFSPGITTEHWIDSILKLENVLDITIGSITQEKRSKDICVSCCRGKYDFNRNIQWNSEQLLTDSKLIIGECMYSPITVDLSQDAHLLIGGSTGCGKTWLLKHLIMQCVKKGYVVVIADFKGGIDFPKIWRKKSVLLTEETEAIKCLQELNTIILDRKSDFSSVDAKDIDEFNSITGRNLSRFVFCCDELAELLDCTGLSKEEKEKKREITYLLARISRIGRAYGVHLLLSTQRPDCDIMPGQIKSNITYRICGKADDVLSRIVLDNTQANDRIPSDSIGVFVDNRGTLFKGYFFDERDII